MILSDAGESRIRGYLYVLERSLMLALPRDVAADAVREIESHLRERVSRVPVASDERGALEQILAELGPPLRVAQAYSAERTIDEAVTTGRFVPIVRAIGHVAATTVLGFFTALGLFVGYMFSFAFFALALLKIIFPEHVGIQFVNGIPVGLSAQFPLRPDLDLRGGYWVVPLTLACGLGSFVLTHRCARRFLGWWRGRRQAATMSVVER